MKNQSENKVYTLAEVLGKHTIAELKQMKIGRAHV